jgi:hypothetical protein
MFLDTQDKGSGKKMPVFLMQQLVNLLKNYNESQAQQKK